MEILIQSKGAKQGPFPLDHVKQLVQSGQISLTDLGWSEGMTEWKTLSSFPELRTFSNPPPVPGGDFAPPLQERKKAEPLAVWSMILGIISIIGCSFGGFFAAIPAVICGHMGLSRIKKNPGLRGGGMAISGLVTGYLSIVCAPILVALALPAITAALDKGQATQMLSNCKQIYLAVQTAQLDGETTGNPKLGFPATAKITSKAALRDMLISNNYLTADDLAHLGFQDMMIANVADDDPPETIFLKRISPNGKFEVVFRKGGDGGIYRVGRDPFSTDPPRSPAFLD